MSDREIIVLKKNKREQKGIAPRSQFSSMAALQYDSTSGYG